jgi:tetratricopeptide (TPR) repeat protein
MIWIFISVVFVGSFILVNMRAVKGPKYSLDELHGVIKALLKRGYENGQLRIEACPKYLFDVRSQPLLEFRKYIHSRGRYGIMLYFSEKSTRWSSQNVLNIQAMCHAQGIAYRAFPDDSDVLQAISVDFGKDAHAAYRFCKHLFVDIFGFSETMKFFALFEHGAEEGVLIEEPHMETRTTGFIQRLASAKREAMFSCYHALYWTRAKHFSSKGQFHRAVAMYTQSIERYPHEAIGYYNRGVMYGRMEQDALAIEDYTRALTYDPNSVEAYCQRGLAYARTGDYERAVEDLTCAIAKDAFDTSAYMERGAIFATCGHYDDALQDFTHVIKLDSTTTYAYRQRGAVYTELGDIEHAMEDFEAFLEGEGATPEHVAEVQEYLTVLRSLSHSRQSHGSNTK